MHPLPRPPAASPAADAAGAALARQLVADLVGACIELVASSYPGAPLGPASVVGGLRRKALLDAVHAAIDVRLRRVEWDGVPLRPEELTPAALAGAHSMSVRSLHQLHEDCAESPSARVRRFRLEGARRQLSGPETGTIAAVAARWGFADAAHFTRAYKDRFGDRPSDTMERTVRDPAALEGGHEPL